ncbi:MAG TPA: HAMP domain-containing protein [Chloroflexota bacterium]|nr:HAMP domain-containing protein [Chloroflexota bacterium]HUM67964.1 HAMP domain-containing protein [Chloroflexota bacterium]
MTEQQMTPDMPVLEVMAAEVHTETTNPQTFSLFRRIPISRKLTIGFSILVLLTLLVAALSYFSSDDASQKIEDTNQLRVPIALEAAAAESNLLRMLSNTRGYLALGDERFLYDYLAAQIAFESNLDNLEPLLAATGSSNQEQLAILSQLRMALLTYDDWAEESFVLRDDQLAREPAYKIVATEGTTLAGNVLLDTQKVIDSVAREAAIEDVAVLRDLARFQSSFLAMLSGLRSYTTTRNRSYRSEYIANSLLNDQAWTALQERIGRGEFNEEQVTLLTAVGVNREAFLVLPEEQVFPVLESDEWRQDLLLFREKVLPLADDMLRLLENITASQQLQLQRELGAGTVSLSQSRQLTLTIGAIAIVFGVMLAYLFRRNIVGPVGRLTAVSERIRGGDLQAQAQVESADEIGVLALTFNRMTGQLRTTLGQVRQERDRADNLLNVVIPIGVELSSEQDFDRMLEKMLVEAKTFCHADAGSLYLRTEDEKLQFVIMRNNSLDIALGGTTGNAVTFPPLALFDEHGRANHQNVAAHVTHTGQAINIPDVYAATEFDFSGPRRFDEQTGYRTQSMLTIPLKNSLGDVKGVLQLLNATDAQTGQIIPFDPNLQQMMESFSSLAVAALEAYIREQVLRQEIQQLRIEIDEAKLQKTVSETVDSDFFQDLQARAADIRRRRQSSKEEER